MCLTYFRKIGGDLDAAHDRVKEYKTQTHEDLVQALERISKKTLSAASNPNSSLPEIVQDLHDYRIELSKYKDIDIRPIVRGLISNFSDILAKISPENRNSQIVFTQNQK